MAPKGNSAYLGEDLVDPDDLDLEDDYEPDHLRDEREEGCVLGAECCSPHPFHGPDECYSAEMAEDYERELAGEH